jgi:hypothetical protein
MQVAGQTGHNWQKTRLERPKPIFCIRPEEIAVFNRTTLGVIMLTTQVVTVGETSRRPER